MNDYQSGIADRNVTLTLYSGQALTHNPQLRQVDLEPLVLTSVYGLY